MTVQEFCPEFHYIKGKQNKVADALSRNTQKPPEMAMVINAISLTLPSYSPKQLGTEQRNNQLWGPLIQRLEDGVDIRPRQCPVPVSELYIEQDILHRLTPTGIRQIIVPKTLVNPTIQLIHDSPVAGHTGKDKSLEEARRRYYWPRMARDIHRHVDHCSTCAQLS